MSFPPKNYYQILQVDPLAEKEVIEAAYKKLALKYHPDKSNSVDAHKKMQEINEAYSVLIDTNRRYEYDERFNAQNNYTDSADEDFNVSESEEFANDNTYPSHFVVPKTIEEKYSNKYGWIGVFIGILVSLIYSLGGRHWFQDFILGLIITIPVGGFLGGIVGHIYGLVKKKKQDVY